MEKDLDKLSILGNFTATFLEYYKYSVRFDYWKKVDFRKITKLLGNNYTVEIEELEDDDVPERKLYYYTITYKKELLEQDLIFSEFLQVHPQLFIDWNSINLLVDKIEHLYYRRVRQFYFYIDDAYIQIKVSRMKINLFSKWGKVDKKSAYRLAILEFIKYYNSNIVK